MLLLPSLLLLLCFFIPSGSCSYLVSSLQSLGTLFLGRPNNYTGLLFWSLIPEDSRYEIIKFYRGGSKVPAAVKPVISTQAIAAAKSLNKNYTSADFINLVKAEYKDDWYAAASTFLLDAKNYNERSQMTLFLTIIQKAPPSVIKKILKDIRFCREDILKKIQHDVIFEIILKARDKGKDMVAIFKIIQMFSDFDLADADYLTFIRNAAFSMDDGDLLMLTEEYPDLIEPVSACQERLMEKWDPHRFPKIWDQICKSSEGAVCQRYKKHKFVKFPMFDQAVDTYDWDLAMFATASKNYNAILKMPNSLATKACRNSAMRTPGAPLSRMEHIIPLIEDRKYREQLCKKYNVSKTDISSSFDAFNANKVKSVVRVVKAVDKPFWQWAGCENSNDRSARFVVSDYVNEIINDSRK